MAKTNAAATPQSLAVIFIVIFSSLNYLKWFSDYLTQLPTHSGIPKEQHCDFYLDPSTLIEKMSTLLHRHGPVPQNTSLGIKCLKTFAIIAYFYRSDKSNISFSFAVREAFI